jgi:tetratricopeptide (TPR) repeat protein
MLVRVVGIILLTIISAKAQQEAITLFEQAHAALDSQQYHQADRLFTRALQIQPGNYEGYFYRGLSRYNLHQSASALTDYSIFLEYNPNHAEALFQRGQLHYELGHYQQAIEDLLKLLTVPKGETSTVFFRMPRYSMGVDKLFTSQNDQRDYILNYIGLSLAKLKRYPEAISYFDSAIRISPLTLDYYLHRGLAYEGLSNMESALNDYQYILSIDSTHGLALHNLAALKKKESPNTFSEQYYSKAIEAAPNLPYGYTERAFYRMENKNYKGAIEDYTEALMRDSNNAELWLNRGVAKDKVNDKQGAITDLSEAILLKLDYSLAYMNRANVYVKMKQYEKAMEDYDLAIAFNRDYGLAYFNRAILHHRLKDKTNACTDIRTAKELGIAVTDKMFLTLCLDN